MTPELHAQPTAAPRARLIPVHANNFLAGCTASGCLWAIVAVISVPTFIFAMPGLNRALSAYGLSSAMSRTVLPIAFVTLFSSFGALYRCYGAFSMKRWLNKRPVPQNGDVAPWAVAYFEAHGHRPDTKTSIIVQKLFQAGRTGNALCVTTPANQLCWTPVPHNFEPRLLSDRNPGFIAIAAGLTPPITHMEQVALADPNDAARLWAGWRIWSQLHNGWMKLIVIVFLLFWSSSAWLAYQQGRLTFRLVAVTALIGLLIVDPVRWERHNKQFFVVPGGLLVRNFRGSHSAQPQLKLYDAATSVLGIVHGGLNNWTLHVVDAAGEAQLAVSPSEAEMALRAWLSPIPPPRVEELSDLAEQ